MGTMTKTKVRITWNGMDGDEWDYVVVKNDISEDVDTVLTDALIKLVRGQIVSVGDSFTVQEIE